MSENVQKLLELMDLVGQKIHERVCDMGEMAEKMTLAQLKLLKLVGGKKRLSMADIAKDLGIAPASATSLVDRLVQQGWLARINDKDDRRKVYIEFAEERKTEWVEHQQSQMKRMAEFLSVLSEEESEKFISILETLSNQ